MAAPAITGADPVEAALNDSLSGSAGDLAEKTTAETNVDVDVHVRPAGLVPIAEIASSVATVRKALRIMPDSIVA